MSSRNLKDAVPLLQEATPKIIRAYEELFPERNLIVICTLRSNAEQARLYAKGRTEAPIGKKYILTQCDGVSTFSKHNPNPKEPLAEAVDFGVVINGKYTGKDEYYYPLLDLARAQGLISGADFKNTTRSLQELLANKKEWKDWAHVEVPGAYYKTGV